MDKGKQPNISDRIELLELLKIIDALRFCSERDSDILRQVNQKDYWNKQDWKLIRIAIKTYKTYERGKNEQ